MCVCYSAGFVCSEIYQEDNFSLEDFARRREGSAGKKRVHRALAKATKTAPTNPPKTKKRRSKSPVPSHLKHEELSEDSSSQSSESETSDSEDEDGGFGK